MLSYLHGFHAGNHADVLKHVVLASALTLLGSKPKPLRYIDTHAGAGGYDLETAAAQKNREYLNGIGRIWSAPDAPAAVARLVEIVRRYNADAVLRRYPGSPRIAAQCLRAQDRLCLFELHPREHDALAHAFGGDAHVRIERQDGLVGSIGLVPPPDRRGFVLIDPSYELADEPDRVLDALGKLNRRFSTGVVAIWYPVLERRWCERFERRVRKLVGTRVSTYELEIAANDAGPGLKGSGVLVVNPPWKLDEEIGAALPWLAARLGDGQGRWRLTPAVT